MKNIELKVKVKNFKEINERLKKMRAEFARKLIQVDTYYNVPAGRLKFREINRCEYEFIFYQRPDRVGSKISDYLVWKIKPSQAELAKSFFKKILGEKLKVVKTRRLWLYKNTRIHLDQVKNIGNFLELETVIAKKDLIFFKKEHEEIIKLLNLNKYKKIDKSYSDLVV